MAQSFYDPPFHCYGDRAEETSLNYAFIFFSCLCLIGSPILSSFHSCLLVCVTAPPPAFGQAPNRPLSTYSSSQSLLIPQLQTSQCILSDIGESLDQTKSNLNTERQQRQQIEDQLHHANREMEHLQQELTHTRRTTQKKVIGLFLKVFIQTLNCINSFKTSPVQFCCVVVTLKLRHVTSLLSTSLC